MEGGSHYEASAPNQDQPGPSEVHANALVAPNQIDAAEREAVDREGPIPNLSFEGSLKNRIQLLER